MEFALGALIVVMLVGVWYSGRPIKAPPRTRYIAPRATGDS